jgi:hypothetical protein
MEGESTKKNRIDTEQPTLGTPCPQRHQEEYDTFYDSNGQIAIVVADESNKPVFTVIAPETVVRQSETMLSQLTSAQSDRYLKVKANGSVKLAENYVNPTLISGSADFTATEHSDRLSATVHGEASFTCSGVSAVGDCKYADYTVQSLRVVWVRDTVHRKVQGGAFETVKLTEEGLNKILELYALIDRQHHQYPKIYRDPNFEITAEESALLTDLHLEKDLTNPKSLYSQLVHFGISAFDAPLVQYVLTKFIVTMCMPSVTGRSDMRTIFSLNPSATTAEEEAENRKLFEQMAKIRILNPAPQEDTTVDFVPPKYD